MFDGNFVELSIRIKEKLGKNFAYIIGAGSYGVGEDVSINSDIDFVLVVRNIGYKEKRKINDCFNELKDNYGLKIGGVVISKDFLSTGNFNLLMVDGKIIQSIIEANLGYQKVFGCEDPNYYLPKFSEAQIKEFSLREAGTIYNMCMRIMTRENLNMAILERVLHYAIIITKLIIQFQYKTCVTNQDLLNEIKKRMDSNVVARFNSIVCLKNNQTKDKRINKHAQPNLNPTTLPKRFP
ncbi:MAG: hypothetical protein UT91_C0014G0029 [Parcubacteria group bacterium GW2011_GWA2_40_23]|nr:MAG: hypothetical protein UT91_C0014G0029 [Parcubacteria group bacterium GW2011_GWA2_40_23]